ncbi:hypothetical protein MPSEU_000396200 [Mayamaea pseudoterrestris]|nr:hypothetical protein MPSEU_000396200 [Mayamaea pseudoterrestris]
MNYLQSPFPQGHLLYNGYTVLDPKNYVVPGQLPLFSLAFYNGSHMQQHQGSEQFQDCHPLQPVSSTFDEFKDMTLKDILDFSEDLLLENEEPADEDDPLMTTPILETPFFAPPPILSSAISRDIVHPISPSNSITADELEEHTKKRRRGSNESASTPRFREYQAGQWTSMFEALLAYKEQHGDVLVPYTYKENRALARWVKRQRYQRRLFLQGQPSTMTADRAAALDAIGFCWDFQSSNWLDRLEELKDFKRETGHCNVPSLYPENPTLATWVKCQRRQHTLRLQGKPHNITPQRIAELDRLGFTWEIRCAKKQRV